MNWDSRADWLDVGDTVWVDDDDDGSKEEGEEEEKEWRINDGDDDGDGEDGGNDGTDGGSADGSMDGNVVNDKDGRGDGERSEEIDDGSTEGIIDGIDEWAGISWQVESIEEEVAIDGNETSLLFRNTSSRWMKRPVLIIFANSLLVLILSRIEFEKSKAYDNDDVGSINERERTSVISK